MEGDISDRLLRPLPPASLGGELRAALRGALPDLAPAPVLLSDVGRGKASVLTSAGARAPGADVVERVVGVGDRRDLVLGAPCPLARVPAGSDVAVADLRSAALLRAHHPALNPVDPTSRDDATAGEPAPAIRIQPSWPDPGLETRGEVLEAASWLPAAGQGIAVLMTSVDRAASLDHLPVDLDAKAVLAAERAVARAFSGAVVLVRGWTFSDWLGLDALLLDPEGRRAVRGSVRDRGREPARVADALIRRLRDRGADQLAEPHISPRATVSAQVSP